MLFERILMSEPKCEKCGGLVVIRPGRGPMHHCHKCHLAIENSLFQPPPMPPSSYVMHEGWRPNTSVKLSLKEQILEICNEAKSAYEAWASSCSDEDCCYQGDFNGMEYIDAIKKLL